MRHNTETDDTMWTVNLTSLIIFVIILCCFFALCFVWDNDFSYYRASPQRKEYIIRHVIVAADDDGGV